MPSGHQPRHDVVERRRHLGGSPVQHHAERAVAAAYGWPEDISTEDALARLLELNRERAAAQGKA